MWWFIILTTNRGMAISRVGATRMAREEVEIMVAMATIIKVGVGMINPVQEQSLPLPFRTVFRGYPRVYLY